MGAAASHACSAVTAHISARVASDDCECLRFAVVVGLRYADGQQHALGANSTSSTCRATSSERCSAPAMPTSSSACRGARVEVRDALQHLLELELELGLGVPGRRAQSPPRSGERVAHTRILRRIAGPRAGWAFAIAAIRASIVDTDRGVRCQPGRVSGRDSDEMNATTSSGLPASASLWPRLRR